MIRTLIVMLCVLSFARTAIAQGTLAMYCSSPSTAWCQGMAIGFEKATGVKVSVTQKATGELFAQSRCRTSTRGCGGRCARKSETCSGASR